MNEEMNKAMDEALKWLEADAKSRAKCLSIAATALETIAAGGQAHQLRDLANQALVSIGLLLTK